MVVAKDRWPTLKRRGPSSCSYLSHPLRAGSREQIYKLLPTTPAGRVMLCLTTSYMRLFTWCLLSQMSLRFFLRVTIQLGLTVIAKRDKDDDFNSDRTEASMPGPTSQCSFFPSFITSGVDNQLSFFFSVPSYLCILVRNLTTFLCIMEYFLQDLQTFAKLKYVNMDMWYYSLEWTGECRQFRWFIIFIRGYKELRSGSWRRRVPKSKKELGMQPLH